MGSTRLPGKVMMDLAGEPMLARVVNRASRAKRVDEVVVATTAKPQDDPIAHLCKSRGWHCFRGAENDVLDRYYMAAQAYHADVVVRVTADCPLIDPGVVDKVLERLMDEKNRADYSSNILGNRTFPRGLDVEAFTIEALAKAWNQDTNPSWREHVTSYIQRSHEEFSHTTLTHPTDYSFHRWTVDTPEDFQLIDRIYNAYGHDTFSWQEVLTLLDQRPEWKRLNANVRQKEVL